MKVRSYDLTIDGLKFGHRAGTEDLVQNIDVEIRVQGFADKQLLINATQKGEYLVQVRCKSKTFHQRLGADHFDLLVVIGTATKGHHRKWAKIECLDQPALFGMSRDLGEKLVKVSDENMSGRYLGESIWVRNGDVAVEPVNPDRMKFPRHQTARRNVSENVVDVSASVRMDHPEDLVEDLVRYLIEG
jgi:hypothetical protein